MTRILLILALATLAACSPPILPAPAPVIEAEPVYTGDLQRVGGVHEEACIPGDGDGIGGTGCKID